MKIALHTDPRGFIAVPTPISMGKTMGIPILTAALRTSVPPILALGQRPPDICLCPAHCYCEIASSSSTSSVISIAIAQIIPNTKNADALIIHPNNLMLFQT